MKFRLWSNEIIGTIPMEKPNLRIYMEVVYDDFEKNINMITMEEKLLELVNSINSEVGNIKPIKEFYKVENNIFVKNGVFVYNLPNLSDVLLWHSKNKTRSKYSHFEVINGVGYFIIYDSDETYELEWNLKQPTIEKQSDSMIEWLYDII